MVKYSTIVRCFKGSPNMQATVEDFLWIALAAFLPVYCGGWQSWMTLGESVWFAFSPHSSRSASSSVQGKKFISKGESGLEMSIVMVPALLQAMSFHHGSKWGSYAKMASLVAMPQAPIAVILCAVAISMDTSLRGDVAVVFPLVWLLLDSIMKRNLSKTFTYGEMRSANIILSIALLEWTQRLWKDTDSEIVPNDIESAYVTWYPSVALSGSMGCCIVCATTSILPLPCWLRIVLNVLGPLLAVDFYLWLIRPSVNTISSMAFPGSCQWLVGFLMEHENGYHRYWGVVYWVVVLAIVSIPTYRLLSLPSGTVSVVVTRKWFHLIAVLLFGPVTWQFPQLLSLGYAVAACVLLVIETVRKDMPALQAFFVTFLDDRKDDGGHIVVSHMFLILGCAIPLWISQSIVDGTTSTPSSLLLAEFGVIVIGVGDAMGAVVGKAVGKRQWGGNRRTLEGSLAMWLSMILAGWMTCHSSANFLALLTATTFSTTLEAFTLQLDNLVLPLAGSSIILLFIPRQ